jgi:hypothetical protein
MRHRTIMKKLSWWLVAGCAAVALAVGVGIGAWAWPSTDFTGKDRAQARTDALRIGLTATGGAGAAFALLLAFRRQRATEHAAADTRHDATERRVTELYAKGVEQLGNLNAAVRTGGLHALERLAQGHPGQRRPVVSVLCAYLRMPYLDPDQPQPTEDEVATGAEPITEQQRRERRQEREVRLTVQRLLRDHAHASPESATGPEAAYWGSDEPGEDLDVDLTGATLINLDLSGRRIHPSSRFTTSTITGDAWFDGATFTGAALFDEATFTGDALFDKATFTREVWFGGATLAGDALFRGATFTRDAQFDGARARVFYGAQGIWPPGWELSPTTETSQLGTEGEWRRLVRTVSAPSKPVSDSQAHAP